MSPLKISLLLRFYSMPRPNRDLPEGHAFSQAMNDAVVEFRDLGLVKEFVTVYVARNGLTVSDLTYLMLITEKGKELAEQMIDSCDNLYHKVSLDADQSA